MWLYKYIFLVLIVLSVNSCGFKPMYGEQGISNESLVSSRPEIFIGNIPDRQGQILRNLLIDKIYTNERPNNYEYELEFTPLEIKTTEMGIKKDASATRIQVQISTIMNLVRSSGIKRDVVMTRKFKSVGAHNQLDNQLASLVSREDIVEDILKEMAQEITTSIDLYFYDFIK